MSNNITTIATLLSGGEGVGVGARAAGLRHLWGIEIDDDIAQVARDNGFNVITAAIQDIDPHTLEVPDVLHASPECQNASNAKNVKGADTLEEKETPLDVEIAGCIMRYLEVLQPRIFSLENVYGYRRFQSFKMIMVALARLGYFSDVQHLNSADFGVPQTRNRLILRAVRGGLVPPLPAPESWIGWYQAIEDLIPTLPESEFAPWQMARLPDSFDNNFFMMIQGQASDYLTTKQPMQAITANHGAAKYRAFIVDGQNTKSVSARKADEPALTVTSGDKGMPRAFVVGQNYGSPNNTGQERKLNVRTADEPIFTIETNANRLLTRAWLSQGRVVKMTPRCLARFQSFPDSYRLPDHNGLACRVIGNAVAPLMYEKIIRIMSSNTTPAGLGD